MNDDLQSARKPPKRVQLDRFVVAVDGQPKTGYKDRAAAEIEAERISRLFPRVSVEVRDQDSAAITDREPDPVEAA
jgi:hypothetical protein